MREVAINVFIDRGGNLVIQKNTGTEYHEVRLNKKEQELLAIRLTHYGIKDDKGISDQGTFELG